MKIGIGIACAFSLMGQTTRAMDQNKNEEHAKHVLSAAKSAWNASDKTIRPGFIQEDTLKIWNQAVTAMSDGGANWCLECRRKMAMLSNDPWNKPTETEGALREDFEVQCVNPLLVALESQNNEDLQVYAQEIGIAILPAMNDWYCKKLAPFEEALRERAAQK